jgi:3-isopropylmalate/(R)-2-methylmalate dehydratase small subunit
MSTLAAHVLEDLDPRFAGTVKPGDILVAGWNFGCGSSREQAPIALKAAGISVVVAKSFARIFYRNGINIGLPLLELGEHDIQPGSQVAVDFAHGIVTDEKTLRTYSATKIPDVMMEILGAGGLVAYLKGNGNYRITTKDK